MQLRKIPISKIIPNPDNPRILLTPKDREYQQIKKSLKVYGYVQPLIWNERSGYLISGHQRLSVLAAEGVKEIEVVVVDLDPQRSQHLMVALNKITGRWDGEKLALMLDEFIKTPDFDFESIGFTTPEISQILDRYGEQKDADDFDFNATLDTIKEPITKPGDIIKFNNHRILCGDSSKPEDIQLLLGDEKINLLNCDPPYNVSYYGGNRPHAHARPKKHKLWDRIYSDDLSQEEYEKWLKNIFTNINPYFASGAPIYVWNGHRQFGPMYLMLTELGFHVSCVITWKKEHLIIGFGNYNQQTEFCLYGWKENNGAHTWFGPKNESTLWEVHRDLTKNYIHPTQKPVALAQRAIKNSSKRGDLVLDTFLGSGSTLIAAESLERRCLGIEIDPRYCDAIVRRYITYVGKDKISQEILNKYCKEAKDEK